MDSKSQFSSFRPGSLRGPLWVAFALAVLLTHAHAQTKPPCDDGSLSDADGYRIRSVSVDARYLSLPLPQRGTAYTKAGESQLIQSVKQAIDLEKNRESIEGKTIGQVTGKYTIPVRLDAIDTCVQVIDEDACRGDVGHPRCVDVTVRVKTLRFSPDDPAQNVLSAIPRSGSPTITDNVPAPLLALNPRFGVEHDKDVGLSQRLEVSTNLLDLPGLLDRKTAKIRPWRLDLAAGGSKSLTRRHYDSDVTLNLERKVPNAILGRVGVRGSFESSRAPIGPSDLLRNSVSLGGEAYLTPPVPFVKGVLLEGSFSRRYNRVTGEDGSPGVKAVERSANFRAVVNAQFRNDSFRLAVWTERNGTDAPGSSYSRSAVLAGYAKDFGKGNQTFGLELLAGAGGAGGSVPSYALFRTGNRSADFIYVEERSRGLRNIPDGALMRSFGAASEATAGGSRDYWHLNANLSVPVAAWSRPLIPADPIDIDAGPSNCPIATVRDLIKCQAASGETILSAVYKSQGIADHAEKARKEYKGIRSAIAFLTDRANLYALKPLVMFDVARFAGPDLRPAVRAAAGGGLQLTVVIAKFEAGYMRTLNPRPGDDRGNFTVRLYFQNLF